MWSDKLTERCQDAEHLFDLSCEHPERGYAIVEKNIPIERAIQIAEEGGIENAKRTLEDAFCDGHCITIQRPGKHEELLEPHDWS
jgi:hypothetical protein